jgi:hypothetical protein
VNQLNHNTTGQNNGSYGVGIGFRHCFGVGCCSFSSQHIKTPLLLVLCAFPQWRQMVPEEKAKYERMAAEDRERYNRECAVSAIVLVRAILPAITAGALVCCAISRHHVTVTSDPLYLPKCCRLLVFCVQIRDEEVLRQQEERRKAHAVGGETDTRMRHSTVRVPRHFGCPRLSILLSSLSPCLSCRWRTPASRASVRRLRRAREK